MSDQLKTVDIKGKAYVEVNERIKAFRKMYNLFTIETEMLSNEGGVCVFKATVRDDQGRVLSTGHSYEKEGSTFINKTSYLENCETSAVGRALGLLGIGIDTSIASYEEVANAVKQQDGPKRMNEKQFRTFCEQASAGKTTLEKARSAGFELTDSQMDAFAALELNGVDKS